MPEPITDISLDDFKAALENLEPNKIIILRFTAEWCGPCKRIDPICTAYFEQCSPDIQPIVVDVDETIDLYMIYKRYKMLNGLPAIFAYYGNERQDQDPSRWYVPNDSVNTGDNTQVMEFFNRCSMQINKQK